MSELEIRIQTLLDEIKLGQTCWEGNEDVMTFNGEPIGATISRHKQIDRWWPDLKRRLASYLSEHMERRS